MLINTVGDFRRAIRHGKYAWPGGYPCFFLTHDGEALSFEAAKEKRRQIIFALMHNLKDGWRIVAFDINWEDADLTCAHTGKKIEAAYDGA